MFNFMGSKIKQKLTTPNNQLAMNRLTKSAIGILVLFFLSMFMFQSVSFAQHASLELTYTASEGNEYAQLDSIWVSNLTQPGDTLLLWPDTILVIEFKTTPQKLCGENKDLSIFQNFPNPVQESTIVPICIPDDGNVMIMVTDPLGRIVLTDSRILEEGYHVYKFVPGSGKTHLFTVFWRDQKQSIKILKISSSASEAAKIEYLEGYPNDDNTEGDFALKGFPFRFGDVLEYRGFIGTKMEIIYDSPSCSTAYTFQFSTTPVWSCGDTLKDDRDGDTYKTILIGNQCWMEENLAYLPSVSPPVYGSFTNPLYYVYDYYGTDVEQAKNTTNYQEFGALYNWPAALTACPSGWHLPSDDDFCILTQFVDSTVNCDVFGFSGTDAGIKMKSTSSWLSGGNGTNESGYNALSAGYRSFYYSTFWHKGQVSIHWSASELNVNNAIGRELHNLYTNVKRYSGRKHYGFSVRCLKTE